MRWRDLVANGCRNHKCLLKTQFEKTDLRYGLGLPAARKVVLRYRF
jgi:hypothetical protein